MIHSFLFCFMVLASACGFTLNDYPEENLCNGPEDPDLELPASGHKALLEWLNRIYPNCTHIRNNLVITKLTNEDDISFLKTIKSVEGYVKISDNIRTSISLPNLKIIKGHRPFSKFGEKAGLYIANNKSPDGRLALMDLRSLRSVANNNIFIKGNSHFCYLNTINWTELLEDETKQVIHFNAVEKCSKGRPKCSSTCESSAHCWGPGNGYCQNFAKCPHMDTCSESRRCWTKGRCCNVKCAGGCHGSLATQCEACRYFRKKKECASECPRRYITIRGQKRKNPDFLFNFGSFCVKKCPDSFVEFGDTCRASCPLNYFIENGICHSCDEVDVEHPDHSKQVNQMLKACKGNCHLETIVDEILKEDRNKWMKDDKKFYKNGNAVFTWRSILKRLINCTRLEIRDGIRIFYDSKHGKESIRVEDLENLRNIRDLYGSLYIDLRHYPSVKNLSFLAKLETISTSTAAGLTVINGTNLEFLGLNRLRLLRVSSGKISNNPKLCFLSPNKILADPPIRMTKNRNPVTCKNEKKVCNGFCKIADGCWGPGANMCVSCQNVQVGDQCARRCSDINGFFHNVSNPSVCARCHPECEKTCRGSKPDQCIDGCKHVQDDQTCRKECPNNKYVTGTPKRCLRCSKHCAAGRDGRFCFGPSSMPNENGCKFCKFLAFDNNFKLLGCRRGCPTSNGSYANFLSTKQKKQYADYTDSSSKACIRCHPFCKRCNGRTNDACDKCNYPYFKYDGQICKKTCVELHFEDFSDPTEKRCVGCHAECRKSCNGSSAFDCEMCQYARIYVNEKLKANGPFKCVSTCPKESPHAINQGNLRICMSTIPVDKKAVIKKAAIGACVAIFVIIGLIALLLIRRRQKQLIREREEVRAKYTRRVEEELVPLSRTGQEPNFGKLRIISAKHLIQGNRIGAGQFGTVFRGVWMPEVEEDEVAVKIDVAIKELKSSNSTASKEFLAEAHVMASVNSPYCVHLLGVSLVSPMKLVSVFVPLGNLTSYMPKHRKEITNRIMLTWALQIAKGMEYLERKGIVHRDLAARNVLLDDLHLVRITDFGLAKLVDPGGSGSLIEKGDKLPIQWLAIECLRELLFSHKSDVWAFGVTLWEILMFTTRKPYGNMRIREIVDFLEKGERLEQPNNCSLDFYLLLLKCWVNDEDGRPTFDELIQELTDMAADPSQYISMEMDDLDPQLSRKRFSIGGQKQPLEASVENVGNGYLDPMSEQSANDDRTRNRNGNASGRSIQVEDADPFEIEFLMPERSGQPTDLPDGISNKSSVSKSHSSDGYMAVTTEV